MFKGYKLISVNKYGRITIDNKLKIHKMHKTPCTLINLIHLITVIWGLLFVVVVLQHLYYIVTWVLLQVGLMIVHDSLPD